ncbi:MAG: DUF935 family protein [Chthonomonadaceae bacterium]|nr:DUF935 family protein [Chthonomonadaceae bacterium]
MRLFKKPFQRKTKSINDTAPQLAQWERAAFASPGHTFGDLSYDTYDQMTKDSMVQTVLTLKKLAVLAADFRIVPASHTPLAQQKADFVVKAFDRMEGSPLQVIGHAADAFTKGWSVQEVVYAADKGHYWIEAVRPKDPSGFGLKVNKFGKIEGLSLRVPGEPDRDLPKEKFAVYIHRRQYGLPKGQSDLDAAYPHWKAKQGLLKAWKLQLEKFAIPTVMGRYERGLPPEEQTTILRALQDFQSTSAVIYPQEIEVSLLGGGREPSTGFQEAIEFHNREIARAVLGQTLTTDEGRRVGSLALGKVHLQILLLQINALRRELAEEVMTEQVVRPLVELNFGPGEVPRFEFSESTTGVFSTGDLR